VAAAVDLRRRAVAEGIGTALLLATVIGSGIMGEKLAGGNVAIALLANTIATGAGLVALILTFGSISGAHFNPAVTLADATQAGLPWREVPVYLFAQVLGAFVGVAVAHLMFVKPVFFASTHDRSGAAQLVSEFVATFGTLGHLGVCAPTYWRRALRGRGVHYGRLLVHVVHVVREPRCDDRPSSERHLRRNPSDGCSGVRHGPTSGGWGCYRDIPVAGPRAT
jgi:hypothetical protein